MFLYVILIVCILYFSTLWDFSQLKSTIIWSLSVAIISLLRSNQIPEGPDYFKQAVRDTINLVIVLEFVFGFYVFPLAGELILVPVSVFIGVLKGFSSTKKEYRVAEKFIDSIFVIYGVLIIAFAAYKLWTGFDYFATMQTFRDFYTPPLLSLLFLPYLLGLSTLMVYERSFRKLRNNISDDVILAYAKKAAVKAFYLRTRQLDRWAHTTYLEPPKTIMDVRVSIVNFKKLIDRETNPQHVSQDQGWSPQYAKNFLAEFGLITGHYNKLYDNKWSATSNYLKSDRYTLNNIDYRISGDQVAVKLLKLRLNVWEPSESEAAFEKFVGLSESLLEKALNADIETNLDELIRDCQNDETIIAGRKVSVNRKLWNSTKTGGFEISIELSPEPK